MATTGRASSYDHLIKLLLIGDSGVGKSCLLQRFAEDSYCPSFITTIGIDFKIRTVEIDGKKIKLQIWDTAGQERFRTITTAYYRGAMGILLVFDITNETSFNNIKSWLHNIHANANEGVNIMLVGNKCDLESKRVVSAKLGADLAHECGADYIETSVVSSLNVETAFLNLTRDVKKRLIDSQIGGTKAEGAAGIELGTSGKKNGDGSRTGSNSKCC